MSTNPHKRGRRKQLIFDLNQKELAQNYPKPPHTINPFFYRRAYDDIRAFMESNGFTHRQGSSYTSIEPVSDFDIRLLVLDLAKEMPWLAKCFESFDSTNIGKQHSLTKEFIAAAESVSVNQQVTHQYTAHKEQENRVRQKAATVVVEAAKNVKGEVRRNPITKGEFVTLSKKDYETLLASQISTDKLKEIQKQVEILKSVMTEKQLWQVERLMEQQHRHDQEAELEQPPVFSPVLKSEVEQQREIERQQQEEEEFDV